MKDDASFDEIERERKALMKEEKDKRIKKEILKLRELFKEIAPKTFESVLSLVKNAAFMTITLEDLQEAINEDGTISTYKNGENQFGTKKSPEVEVYNTMIKNHMGIMRQLTDLMPAPEKIIPKPEDAFLKIARRAGNA
jgi:histone H3/H4